MVYQDEQHEQHVDAARGAVTVVRARLSGVTLPARLATLPGLVLIDRVRVAALPVEVEIDPAA